MKIKEKEEKNLNLSLRSLENYYNVTGQQIFKKKKHPQWVDNLVHLCRSTVWGLSALKGPQFMENIELMIHQKPTKFLSHKLSLHV